MSADKKTAEWLWIQTRTQHRSMTFLLFGDILFAVSSAFFALVCKSVVDHAVAGNLYEVFRAGILLMLIICLQFALRIYLNNCEEYIRSKTAIDLRRYMTELLMHKDYAAVKKVHSGEWMNRMFSDVSIIGDGAATILPNLASMATRLICAAVVLLYLQPVFAYVFILGGTVLIVCTGVLRRQLKNLHREVQEKQGKVQSFLQELVENFLIVKVFREEQTMEDKIQQLQQEHFKAQMRRRKIAIFANSGFGLIFQTGYLFAIIWGARGILYGTLSYGTLTAILQLVGQIQAPVANLSGILPKIYGMFASAERIMEIEKFTDEKITSAGLKGDFKEIEAENIDFSYGKAAVLKQVSFKIQKGDMAALTGLSGGGKSTLFLLLLGIYRTENGKIVLKTTEQTAAPGKETRALFTYVPQGNGLFSGTLKENILFGLEDISEQQIWGALQIACAESFVKSLPGQLAAMVGEKGMGLSEGQIQRIAIARAVLRENPILLLDEATSALDAETEAKVLNNISKLQKKTCIIVTHREAALQICNKQFLLNDGKLYVKGNGPADRQKENIKNG